MATLHWLISQEFLWLMVVLPFRNLNPGITLVGHILSRYLLPVGYDGTRCCDQAAKVRCLDD